MSDELKPCPFCGTQNARSEKSANEDWTVECQTCGAGTGTWSERADAVNAWNTRGDFAKVLNGSRQNEPLTSFERAERLFRCAEKLRCDTPTEAMIADAIQDAEFDTLHNPEIVAQRHGGQEGCASLKGAVTEAETAKLREANVSEIIAVADSLDWASWLETVSDKAKGEIRAQTARLRQIALAASAQPETSPTAATLSAGEQPSKETGDA